MNQLVLVAQTTVEAARAVATVGPVGVTRPTRRSGYQVYDRVLVTIDADLVNREPIPAGFAFCPKSATAGTPERRVAARARGFERAVVGVPQHQHAHGGHILHDNRQQTTALVEPRQERRALLDDRGGDVGAEGRDAEHPAAVAGMGEEALAVLGPGEAFGEMSLFDEVARSADAQVQDPCRLLVLERSAFEELMLIERDLAYEILWNMVRILIGRLRETNDKMTFLSVTGRF